MQEYSEKESEIDSREPLGILSPKSNGVLDLTVAKNLIVEVSKRPDKEFIPMVRYRGGVSIQRLRALLSFALSMKEANVCTTGKICKIGQQSRDLIHLHGLHAPIQNPTLYSLFSRLHDNPKFTSAYIGLREWMDTVAASCSPSMRVLMFAPVTRISWTSTDTRWEWRKVERPFVVRQKEQPLFYPYAASKLSEVQQCELLMAVHDVVPKNLPEQLRGDICQELIVQILTGESRFANIQDNPRKYIHALMKRHRSRYGTISLDSKDEEKRTLMEKIGI